MPSRVRKKHLDIWPWIMRHEEIEDRKPGEPKYRQVGTKRDSNGYPICLKILLKMGYKLGTGMGKHEDGRMEPVSKVIKRKTEFDDDPRELRWMGNKTFREMRCENCSMMGMGKWHLYETFGPRWGWLSQ